jgi:hypothetical protein
MTHAFFSDHSSPHFDKYHFNMTNVPVGEQALEGVSETVRASRQHPPYSSSVLAHSLLQ